MTGADNPSLGDTDVDSRLMLQIGAHGEPRLLTPCQYKGRPAALALCGKTVVLAALARGGSEFSDLIIHTIFRTLSPTSGVLTFGSGSRTVEFQDGVVGGKFAETLKGEQQTSYRDIAEKRKASAEDIEKEEAAEMGRRTSMPPGIVVSGCRYIGGAGAKVDFKVGNVLSLRFQQDGIYRNPGLGAAGALLPIIPMSANLYIDLGGPGLVRAGGGFSGGGAGVAGALEGMAIAAVLNAATTKSSVATTLSIGDGNGEAFFICDSASPYELRVRLSSIFVAVRSMVMLAEREKMAGGQDNLLDQLERLARLHASNELSDVEFATLKARLVHNSAEPGD